MSIFHGNSVARIVHKDISVATACFSVRRFLQFDKPIFRYSTAKERMIESENYVLVHSVAS